MILHGDIMVVLVCAALAVPAINSLLVYSMLQRFNARLSRMTSELSDPDEIQEIYGTMFTDDLAGAIGKARRRFAITTVWTLLIPVVWYLFAPLPQRDSSELALMILLGANAAMLVINVLMRFHMFMAAHSNLECVLKARRALKKHTFKQLVTLGLTLLTGMLIFG